MDTEKVVETLYTCQTEDETVAHILNLRFDQRFNALREIVYHIDICLSEGRLDNTGKFLQMASLISDNLYHGHFVESEKEMENIRTLKIIARKKKAKVLEAQGRVEEAISEYLLLIKDLRLPREKNFLAELLMEIGIIEEQMNRGESAISKFNQSAEIYSQKGDDFNHQAALFNLAHVMYDMEDYDKAQSYCLNVIREHTATGKVFSSLAHSYLELANIYELFRSRKMAQEYYRKSLDIYNQLNNRVKMSDILNRLGAFEMEDGNFMSAVSMFQKSLNLKMNVDYQQGRANFFHALGEAHRWGGNPEKAMECYLTAYDLYDGAGVDSRKTVIKHIIYKLEKKMGKPLRDLGTFIEKYDNHSHGEKKETDFPRIEYRRFSGDGYSVSSHSLSGFDPPRVRRKYLSLVLNNLARTCFKLNNEREYRKYLEKKRAVDRFSKKQ